MHEKNVAFCYEGDVSVKILMADRYKIYSMSHLIASIDRSQDLKNGLFRHLWPQKDSIFDVLHLDERYYL